MIKMIIREEVEGIIKELTLDRKRISEVSYIIYSDIIQKTVDTFIIKDGSRYWYHTKSPEDVLHWSNIECRFKPEFSHTAKHSPEAYSKLKDVIPKDKTVYVLFEDKCNKFWVYEMYGKELSVVLGESMFIGDYYIVSKKFDWLISEDHHQIIHLVGSISNRINKI